MTLDEMRDKLDEMQDELESMSGELEGMDKSELSTQNQFYLREAIKLMRSGQCYLEESGTYLELD